MQVKDIHSKPEELSNRENFDSNSIVISKFSNGPMEIDILNRATIMYGIDVLSKPT